MKPAGYDKGGTMVTDKGAKTNGTAATGNQN
jgi:hypothetical protein